MTPQPSFEARTTFDPHPRKIKPKNKTVMRGLAPRIHVFLLHRIKDVDGRGKPGHDDLF
jgi:hypothetical protein